MGGARWAPGVPLLAGDVLGGDRPGDSPREQTVLPGAAVALVRRKGHHLPRRPRAILGPGTRRVHPAPRSDDVRRFGAADAAGPLHLADRPPLDHNASRDRAGARERLIDLSLPPRGWILRRLDRSGGHVLDVLLLVRRMPVAHGRSPQGALLLREDARLRESLGIVRRGAGPTSSTPRQLPAGLHAPGADQRRLRPRPATFGRRSPRLTLEGAVPSRLDPSASSRLGR